MGLISDFFTIKSRRQKDLEQLQYAQWAYPLGPEQAQLVGQLLRQLLPEEKDAAVAIYLMGKEAYHNNPSASRDDKLEQAFYAMRPHLPGRKLRRVWRYLSMILADAAVVCLEDYPTAEQLQATARQLEEAYR